MCGAPKSSLRPSWAEQQFWSTGSGGDGGDDGDGDGSGDGGGEAGGKGDGGGDDGDGGDGDGDGAGEAINDPASTGVAKSCDSVLASTSISGSAECAMMDVACVDIRM